MKALSVTSFKNIGDGLSAANSVGKFRQLEILECSAQNGNLLLAIEGPLQEIDVFHNNLLALKPISEHLFKTLDSRVWEAHLSLTNSEVKENLIVLETGFFSDLLLSVEALFKMGFSCVDFRAARGASRVNYALMTGELPVNLVSFKLPPSVTATQIESISDALRSFLDLRPNKA